MDIRILTPVTSAIKTLSATERQKLSSWLDHLQNWENDEHTRSMAKATPYQNVFVLNTTDDVRIFFSADTEKQSITVLDIAKPSRFEVVQAKPEK